MNYGQVLHQKAVELKTNLLTYKNINILKVCTYNVRWKTTTYRFL